LSVHEFATTGFPKPPPLRIETLGLIDLEAVSLQSSYHTTVKRMFDDDVVTVNSVPGFGHGAANVAYTLLHDLAKL
jgi:hypothetical protein